MSRIKKYSIIQFWFWLLGFPLVHGNLYAQEKVTQLDEVEIVADELTRFGAGASISKVDSSVIENYGRQSLSELLVNNSSVYIKQYGAGQLASISFRGTGAGHTAVRWNSLQVGYPSLGQADFSTIPMEFISEVQLLHGSSSARYGSGAIGGTVHLSTDDPRQGFNVQASQSVGSFGTTNSYLQLQQSGSKGYICIGGFYNQSENNFKMRSSNGEDLGRMSDAEYWLTGASLKAGYHLGSSSSITLNFLNSNTDRNLQSSVGDNQRDQNLWSSLAFRQLLTKGEVNLTYGYLFDRTNYNSSITDSYQNIAQATFLYDVSSWLAIEAGTTATWIQVQTPNYENSEANETRADVFASATLRPTKRLESSINLRQSFVSGYSVPFTPSVGLTYSLFNKEKWKMNVRGQLSKGYRVPTLNDRFWVPGGNADLDPEESVNVEVGADIDILDAVWVRATTYRMWVNNWILWLPQGSFWSPLNARKVEGNGIEMEMGYGQNIGEWQAKYWLNYAYTKSTNAEALDDYDRSAGKQMPYVPFHNGNANMQFVLMDWSLLLNGQFTGKRFTTTDNESEVPGFALLNLRVSKQFNWNLWSLNAYGNVNNITNTNYQSVSNRAMPGINFLLGIKINFNI